MIRGWGALHRWRALLLGLLFILAYWYSVHPLGFTRGYFEDWCSPDLSRQLMAEAIERTGAPNFWVESYLAPVGLSAPFMAWEIEMSWLGSYFWKWGRDFPFLWVYYGLSLVLSYLGVGFILRKMKLSAIASWGLAAFVILFHVPRHYKTWHHFPHLLQHWVYWSIFLDAWIWQRFLKKRRWSWSLEAWRALCVLGMLTTAGNFWGPLLLEWGLVRACMLGVWGVRCRRVSVGSASRSKHVTLTVEGRWREAWPAAVLGVVLLGLVLRWYLPLAREAKALGEFDTQLAWFGHWRNMLRPLWLDRWNGWMKGLLGRNLIRNGITYPETVITVGWVYWFPLAFGLYWTGRLERLKQGVRGAGVLVALPFLLVLVLAAIYIDQNPPVVALWVQRFVPFMKYFRVATRWGLLLPPLLGAVIALTWPSLVEGARGLWLARKPGIIACVALLAISTGFELIEIQAPRMEMAPLSPAVADLLREIKQSPGTTVLDLPFCLAGGNGVCTPQSCPNYPASTVSGCFRSWHDKNVYGVYAARLVQSQCEPYQRQPYLSWFDAWRTQRCFTQAEWKDFCSYLDSKTELSAVLLYPDIWKGAGSDKCLAEFEAHLGEPIAQAEFAAHATLGGREPELSRLFRYGTRCKVSKP